MNGSPDIRFRARDRSSPIRHYQNASSARVKRTNRHFHVAVTFFAAIKIRRELARPAAQRMRILFFINISDTARVSMELIPDLMDMRSVEKLHNGKLTILG